MSTIRTGKWQGVCRWSHCGIIFSSPKVMARILQQKAKVTKKHKGHEGLRRERFRPSAFKVEAAGIRGCETFGRAHAP